MKQYLSDLLHLSAGVRWFLLTESMLGMGIGIYNLLLNLHLLALGLNEAQIGAIASFGIIVQGIISIPCGMIASRFGRKKLLVLGLGLMSAGYVTFGTGSGLGMMYTAQGLQSSGLTLLITTEVQLLYSYSRSKREETQAFSLLFAMFTLFTGVGTLAGGFLPEWLGGWRTGYQGALITAGLFLFAGAVGRLILLPRETKKPRTRGRMDAPAAKRFRLPGRTVWIFCIMNLILGVAASFIEPFLNVIVKLHLDWTDTQTSLLLTLNGLVLFAGSFLTPPLLDRIGLKLTYRLIFLVNVAVSLVLAVAMPAGPFSVLLLARGGAFIMINNLMLTHSMSALDEKDRDSFAGLRVVLRSAGSSAAAYTAGLLLAERRYGILFLLAGLTLGAGFVVFERWVRPLFHEKLVEAEESALQA